ncbi:hypothetical protein EN829_003815 [Mesorhizobium sp. M00.F.Ca.ET.186.01.1.1]|nr:hypothetical protein EN848_12400 [bacterium M00.F.Ca.ET.205.01.1.1]TGU55273.1 hypothetical protein EN795_00625 [bacterium M00.F.Ca.ET.152.01.1.1]TGV40434.1 hypothetical protein EN829_003815 [Mesorhizobium sp. M00.F.Ca.ET.186.01.1.1]TGZ45433.1 hypothetical protein EN805_03795 [bacterium M00.F.Ca.ET.162.01.1.1]TIW59996.1 MAG: hypothetical protein E5V48_15565 [Mesorhizobium sp.]
MEHETQMAEAGASARTPPYVSYRTLTTLLEDLKTVGLPPRIDRSVLTRFSGGVGSQLLMALKSLSLVKESGEPTDWLKELVRTYGTANYGDTLKQILTISYPYLGTIDLATATPSMFADAFRNAVDAKEDVLRKCRTFFLHAAKEAGIEIGQRLDKGVVPRASNGKRRGKAAPKIDARLLSVPQLVHTPPPVQGKELEYQLIDLMTEPDIDDNVKQSIWALVQYLTARKMKKAAASQEATA